MKQVNIYYGYLIHSTISANLHPKVQREHLLEIIKNSKKDIIDIYCNSPYVLSYLVVISAYSNSNIPEKEKGIFAGIPPIKAHHFEIHEDGTITEGIYYKDMISDDNLLNNYLEVGNEEYSEFLELKSKYK